VHTCKPSCVVVTLNSVRRFEYTPWNQIVVRVSRFTLDGTQLCLWELELDRFCHGGRKWTIQGRSDEPGEVNPES
jgi:hypothetical protein